MRWERYSKRDLAYSKWHRHLADNVTMVDIDAVEYCNKCNKVLAVMELANDNNQKSKPFMMTLHTARAFSCPGYVVLYTADETLPEETCIKNFRVMKVYPEISGFNDVSPKDYAAWLSVLHDSCCTDKVPDKA